MGFPHSSVGKEPACNAGDPGSIPGSGRSAGEGIGYPLQYSWASLVAQLVKNLPAMRETWVQSLDWEDSLEKRKATHSSILNLENSMDTVHGVIKSWTRLSDFHFHSPDEYEVMSYYFDEWCWTSFPVLSGYLYMFGEMALQVLCLFDNRLIGWFLFCFWVLLLLLSHFSHVRLCATPWMAAHQAPPSMGFSRQEYWSGVPLHSPVLDNTAAWIQTENLNQYWLTLQILREVLFNSLHSVPSLRSGSFFSVLFCGKVYFPFLKL